MRHYLLAGLLVAAAACGGDSGEPSIDSMICDPSALTLNVSTEITCNFHFLDEDGDVVRAHIEFTSPSGMESGIDADFTGAEGLTDSPGHVNVTLSADGVGTGELRVQLFDAEEHASNVLTQAVTVTP